MRSQLDKFDKLNIKNYWILIIISFGYFVQNYAFPVQEGRDFGTYFLYYRDFWITEPEFPIIMLFRTPITSFIFGGLFEIGGKYFLDFYFFLGYLIIVWLLFNISKKRGNIVGVLVLLFTLISIEFFRGYNTVASENPTSIAAVFWFYFGFKAQKVNKINWWILFSMLTLLMVLIRPNHQVLILASLLPLITCGSSFINKFKYVALTFLIIFVGILSYCSFNYIRYDKFEVAHLGPAHMPFYRLFIHEKMIRPNNGPKSEELAELVRTDVLTREVFKKYGIDEKLFWEVSTPRFWIHIVDALNRKNGYLDNTRILKQVAWEACLEYPLVFALGYIDDLRILFEFPERLRLRPRKSVYVDYRKKLGAHEDRCRERGLGIPGEDDFIIGTISQLALKNKNYSRSNDSNKEWSIRSRDPVYLLTRLTYLAGYLRPSISVLLLLNLLGLLKSRFLDNELNFISGLIFCIVIMLAVTAMANPESQFRYPFDPIFIFGGIAGLKSLLQGTFKQC